MSLRLLFLSMLATSCSKYTPIDAKVTSATRYMQQFCASHPQNCNGSEIIVVNRGGSVLSFHGPELLVQRMNCSVGNTNSGDPAVTVTARLINVGDAELDLPQGSPNFTMTATASGPDTSGKLRALDTEQNGFLTPTSFKLPTPSGDPSHPDPSDPGHWSYDEHRITFNLPTANFGAGVTQVKVAVDAGQVRQILAIDRLYWPGNDNSITVSLLPLDPTNPVCDAHLSPTTLN